MIYHSEVPYKPIFVVRRNLDDRNLDPDAQIASFLEKKRFIKNYYGASEYHKNKAMELIKGYDIDISGSDG